MERPGRFNDDDAPRDAGEARFDALLAERFSPAQREAFARELDAHDRQRGAGAPDAAPDAAALRRHVRYQGEVPQPVRRVLSEWLPALVVYAAEQGLGLRDPHQDIAIYTRAAFEAEQGALPPKLPLPASSYQYNALYRRYLLRVVLPEQLNSSEAMLTVVRALLTRLYGDIFLREEVLVLEAYREDVEAGDPEASTGLAEQIAVLSEIPHTTAALEQALTTYARNAGINYQRHPEQARKAFCKELREDWERQRLPAEREALVSEAFAAYQDALRNDIDGGVQALLETVEAQNRQLNFLPPDEAPHYERLRTQNPLHYLRAVKLRLEFLREALAGVVEDFEALATPGAPFPALADERIAGTRAALEQQGLARPYLVPGVRLSDELEAKRTAFPLELHGLMARFPPVEEPTRLFNTLRKRLESHLHQRLYHALTLLRHGMQRSDTGRGEAFAASEHFQTLKGLVANFRFRLPLLESLFLRIGVVLEVAEHDPQAAETRTRFPVEDFSRAWGQFAAHALLAGYLGHVRRLQGFDPARYWQRVEARLDAQLAAGNAGAHLLYLLRRLQVLAVQAEGAGDGAATGLPVLGAILRSSTPAFRFAVAQALRPRPEDKDAAAWRERLDALADSVLQARARSLRNAIVVGTDGDG